MAIVVPVFPKRSETFVVRHLVGLFERGWDVHVVCRRFDPDGWARHPALRRYPELRRRVHVEPPARPIAAAISKAPIEWLRVAIGNPVAASNCLRHGSWGRLYLDATLLRLAPDLVHFEFGSLATGRFDATEAIGARTVVSFRGFDLNFVGLENPDHYDEVWRRADGFHFLGADLWRRARRRGCPDHVTYSLIPPAVDTDRFTPTRPEARSGPVRLLSVGRLEWKKGFDHMLRAVRQLLDEGIDVRYRIVGAGSHRPAIAFTCHALGLSHRVELIGPLDHDRVLDQLAWADLLLHLSVSEGFGNAVLEAQAMATPAIVSDADGLAENVADGETGFVVPRRNPEAAARRLAELARDPERLLAMGRAGRQRVEEHFAPQAEIAAFEDLYRQVLA